MLKKAAITAGVLGFSALTAASMALAQSPTTNNTTNNTTVTPTTTNTTVPGGAPATGKGL